MTQLIAISHHPNPRKRIRVVTNIRPETLILTKQDKERWGNITNKLKCIAEDNLNQQTDCFGNKKGNILHHFELLET